MIRYFYSICFLSFGMGLPLLAKSTGTDNPTPSTSSKAETRGMPVSCSSSAAKAKGQKHQKSEITVTPDISRTAVSSSPASKQEASSSSLLAKNVSTMTYAADVSPVRTESSSDWGNAGKRLARVTAYWAGEGDYYTGRCISATGVRLHDGHCAVDPNIIPYGSVVEIAGVGKYLAVDTGSAVISRTAAKEGGHTAAERGAIVVDLFFEDASEGERFAASAAKYVSITWWTPASMGIQAKAARSLFAEENWTRIESKQL
jgi:3D (Asp-Asp-Asp) domain-containing protein